MKIGREWHWPADDQLAEWKAQNNDKRRTQLSRGQVRLLIRAVRSQRKVIEKLAKMLALEPAVSPLRIFGNNLPPDAPAALRVVAHPLSVSSVPPND